VESSPEEIFKLFLSEISSSNDEQLNRIYSLIERDRFGVERLDGEIRTQIEFGNYGELTKHIWQSFNEEQVRGSSEA
jgi:hypothetical protein